MIRHDVLVGALLAAIGIAIAPDILYYSRFARNDIYHAVWSLLAIIGLFGFITTRKGRFFILGAVALSMRPERVSRSQCL